MVRIIGDIGIGKRPTCFLLFPKLPCGATCCSPTNRRNGGIDGVRLCDTGAGVRVDFGTLLAADEGKPDAWTLPSLDGQIEANSPIVKLQGGALGFTHHLRAIY